MRYFEETNIGNREIYSYLVPCSETRSLSVQYPPNAWTGYIDPNPATPAGIIMVLLEKDPGRKVLSIAELDAMIYRGLNGNPIYFSDPNAVIPFDRLTNLWNLSNEFILVPVMVSNINGTGPGSWFEEDCVRLFTEYGLTLISNPAVEYEFVHFDEITFTHWPADTSIVDFFDISFTDQASGDTIPYTLTNNRSFKLHFSKPEGIFNFEITWKDKDCQALELGVNWAFPTVQIAGDKVPGYQNIEKCIPVRAQNFESVTDFEIQIVWDRDSVSYSTIKNIHPTLLSHLKMGNVSESGNKQVIQLELDAGMDGITLPDSAVLFEWCGRPLIDPGHSVEVRFTGPSPDQDTKFSIYGINVGTNTIPGGIYVQEDRELIYDLNQLCNTRAGKRRMVLNVINDEAYPYSYSFNSSVVPDSILDTFPFLIPDVPPGQYDFTIRDSFGFEITETITVQDHVPPGFDLSIDPDRVVKPTCLRPFGGQIAVTLSPQDQSYKLRLLNDDANFSQDSVAGLVAGQYVIEAEDEMGCIDTVSYTLVNPRDVNIAWNTDDMVLCPGDDHVFLVIEDRSLQQDTSLEFQLDGGEVHHLTDTIFIDQPGRYPLQVWNEDGCTLDTTVVVQSGPDHLSVWDTTEINVLHGDTLNYMSEEQPGLSKLTWSYNSILIGDRNDIHFIPDESGVFSFEAVVYDRCLYLDTLMVRVIFPNQDLPDFSFPNVFTPNGDGANDYYRIVPTRDVQQVISMEVYDRYGNFVFMENYTEDSGGQNQGWNGRHAGVDAPPGVYAVQAKLRLLDGREETVGLDVLLLR